MEHGISGSFDSHPEAAGSARAALDASIGLFKDVLAEDRLDDLRLLLSELVTNSVRHSGQAKSDPVRVSIAVNETNVHVRVTDNGAGFLPAGEPTPRDKGEGGWGLFLVDQLADRWGVQTDGLTTVWFELERHSRGR